MATTTEGPETTSSSPESPLPDVRPDRVEPAEPTPDDSPQRTSFRRRRRALFQPLMGTLGTWFTRALAATWRVRVVDEQHFPRPPEDDGRLVAIWHGRLLVLLHHYRGLGYQVLVSPSGDGELVHAVLRASGYGTLRGSSNKNAPRALREMLRELREARTVVITPDGPRGPMHSTNPGLAWLARATGYPIVCLGIAAKRAFHLSSWDRFTLPLPFTKIVVVCGEPIHVERGGGDEQLDQVTEHLRERLLELERQAFSELGREPDW